MLHVSASYDHLRAINLSYFLRIHCIVHFVNSTRNVLCRYFNFSVNGMSVLAVFVLWSLCGPFSVLLSWWTQIHMTMEWHTHWSTE